MAKDVKHGGNCDDELYSEGVVDRRWLSRDARGTGRLAGLRAGIDGGRDRFRGKKGFNAKYPGIEFEQFRIEPGPAIQRMISEREAGRINVDVLDSSLSYVKPLLDRNLLDPYPWTEVFGISKDYQYDDGRLLACWNLEIPIAYNTSKVKAGEIKSWEDLLDPKWRGQILVEARGIAFAILINKWGEQKTLDYIKRIKENKPLILVGGSPTAEALMSGRVAVAIGTYAGKIDFFKKAGAPVDWALVGPIPAQVYTSFVPKGVRHPNAARLFCAWLASADGQDAAFEYLRYGFLTGNTLSPNGKKMRDAGVEVVTEATDPIRAQKYIEMVGGAIGALK
jgi:iron(III) transport system substrate-binding protein